MFDGKLKAFADGCSNGVALITDRLTRKYLTGVDIAEGYLVVGNATAYFTDARYFYAAKEKLSKVNVPAKLYSGQEDLSSFIVGSGAKTLFIDYTKTTVKEYEDYKTFGLDIKDCSILLDDLRSIKTDAEISHIKKACEIVQTAVCAVLKTIKLGDSEIEIKDRIETEMVKLGAQGPSFDTIVAFGKNSAVPHHETGEERLKPNSVILIDTGAVYNGYCSDITRTVFFGTPTDKFITCYDAVLEANERAEREIFSGIKTDLADKIARDKLKEKGLDKFFTHSLGHGVGLEIHEHPTLSPKKSTELKDGAVFTIEPGVYFDGEFGIRIEDTVMLKDGKVKRLFNDSKKLMIL